MKKALRHAAVSKTPYEKRIEHIVDLMTKSQWTPQSSRRLEAKWKLSGSTVRTYSSEASRRIRYFIEGQKDYMRARILAQLESMVQEARSKKEKSIALKAIDLQCKVLGLNAPIQHVVTNRDYDALTEDEVEERRVQVLAEFQGVTVEEYKNLFPPARVLSS